MFIDSCGIGMVTRNTWDSDVCHSEIVPAHSFWMRPFNTTSFNLHLLQLCESWETTSTLIIGWQVQIPWRMDVHSFEKHTVWCRRLVCPWLSGFPIVLQSPRSSTRSSRTNVLMLTWRKSWVWNGLPNLMPLGLMLHHFRKAFASPRGWC